jgi:nitroimidazol reductase NimA-like FMN-containing flavoprotein (pyridoxamine 5'-phosphate oxidase superfamily)
MPHEQWHILDADECLSLLDQHHLGRVAFLKGTAPIILPVNYALADGLLVFRTDAGSKLEVALRRQPVAFEVDGIDDVNRTGWSVLVRGAAELISDADELTRLHRLPLIAWTPAATPHYVRIGSAGVTGRRINAAEQPSLWLG